MIEFDCPLCGKHFSLSSKFASRKLLCTGCKKEIVVPEESAPTPPLAPVVVQSDDGLDLLRHAFEDAAEAESQRRRMPPPPPKRVAPIAPPPEPVSSGRGTLWVILAVGVVIIAVGVAVFMNLPAPLHPAEIEAATLRAASEKALLDSRLQETQRDSHWLTAQRQWQDAGTTCIELFLAQRQRHLSEVAVHEYTTLLAQNAGDTGLATRLADAKKATSEATAQQDALFKKLQGLITSAQEAEKESEACATRIVAQRNESGRLAAQAAETLRSAGLEAAPVTFEPQIHERPRPAATDDATEVAYGILDFGEPQLLAFCPLIDTSQYLHGKKSWRFLATAPQRIGLTFPKTRDAAWDIVGLKKLSFALRFPVRNELPAIKLPQTAGQIASMTFRLGNAAGAISYTCASPRYFEILFFRGHGKFVTVDVPLSGNALWSRSEEFDAAQLPQPDEPFEKQIDWIEISVTLASPITSLWIDDVKFSPNAPAPPINMRHEEDLQQPDRRRWLESL